MKKRFLLLTLIMCLLGGVNSLSLKAQDEVTIGSGTGTTNAQFFPIYIGSSGTYAISQQIYFANEINMPDGGTITEVSFYTYNNKHTRSIEIYMANTTKTNFSTNTDWVTSATNVFEGDVVFGSGSSESAWIKITLDRGFSYDGTSNLMLCVNDITGSSTDDSNYPKCNTFVGGTNTAKYMTGTHITDLSSLSGKSATGKNTRNIIKLNFVGEPETPTLISPENNATDVFNPFFNFTLGNNTTHYQISIGTAEGTGDPNYTPVTDWVEKEDTEVSYHISDFDYTLTYNPSTTYYWKVVARNGEGNDAPTAESEAASFTTRNVTAVPDAVSIVSPANAAIDQFNPTLSWTFGENTEEYQVLLAKASEDFPEVDAEKWTNTQNAAEGSYTTSGLERGTEYKWQVVTKNFKGVTSSDIYTFTTLDIPTAPTLISPTNETTGVINPTTLQFTLSNNTTQYKILLYKNEDPATVVKDWTDGNGNVSYQISNLEAGVTYYWKVIAKNGAGEAESDTYQFTTANIFPVTEYEITLNGNEITLKWQFADQKANEYQVCFGESEQDIEIWHYPEWVSRKTVDGNLVKDGSFTIDNAGFGDKVYFRVNVRKDGGETVEGATAFYVVLKDELPLEWVDSYNNANDVFVRASVFSVATNIIAKNITIENGGILKIGYNVDLSANTLVVNEGGQFFAENPKKYLHINTVKFNKKIANPDKWEANNKTGWQFISSPFTDASISSFIPGQEEGDYDLYQYDGSAEKQWVNHKESGLGEIFDQGIGYLASYQTKDNLTFTGTFNSINRTNKLSIGQDGMMETPGIYLLGNPFLFNMDWKKISASAYGINATSFVVVKTDGAYEYKTSGEEIKEEIKVGEGFFVLTTKDWASFNYTFTAGDIVAAPSSKSRNAEQSKSLNIIAAGNAGNDNVVVNFAGKSEGFPKLQNFNDDIATVYVQNNGANYGIYNCDENTTEVELSFSASQIGTYSISFDINGDFENVVLVDRLTGIETNMLIEDEYKFVATSNDNAKRFFIRLDNGQQSTDNDSMFVYQSGEELIVNAEGSIEIIDMMGRVVYSSEVINNRINVSRLNNGTYVVRVINETGVKVKKVVIY